MQRRLDQWTTALSAVVLVATLLACKKRAPTTEVPSAIPAVTAAPTPPTATTADTAPKAPAAAAEPDGSKLGEVKRYPDKEKAQTGAARILQDDVKVFGEADNKTADVASLDKGLLVFRLASLPDWELVEIPAGVGKLAPGWIEAKFLDVKDDSKVAREAVATQAKTATVKSAAPKSSATPVASTSTSAKPATSSSAAKAAASASAAASAAASTAAAAAASAKAAADKAAAAAKVAAKNAAKTPAKP